MIRTFLTELIVASGSFLAVFYGTLFVWGLS